MAEFFFPESVYKYGIVTFPESVYKYSRVAFPETVYKYGRFSFPESVYKYGRIFFPESVCKYGSFFSLKVYTFRKSNSAIFISLLHWSTLTVLPFFVFLLFYKTPSLIAFLGWVTRGLPRFYEKMTIQSWA